MKVSMDDIMKATFGEYPNQDTEELNIVFKKTINIKQYESEVMESSVSVKVPKGLTGAERMVILAIMQAQAEYEMYCMLAFKQYISQNDLIERKTTLENGVSALLVKAETILTNSDKKVSVLDYFK